MHMRAPRVIIQAVQKYPQRTVPMTQYHLAQSLCPHAQNDAPREVDSDKYKATADITRPASQDHGGIDTACKTHRPPRPARPRTRPCYACCAGQAMGDEREGRDGQKEREKSFCVVTSVVTLGTRTPGGMDPWLGPICAQSSLRAEPTAAILCPLSDAERERRGLYFVSWQAGCR